MSVDEPTSSGSSASDIRIERAVLQLQLVQERERWEHERSLKDSELSRLEQVVEGLQLAEVETASRWNDDKSAMLKRLAVKDQAILKMAESHRLETQNLNDQLKKEILDHQERISSFDLDNKVAIGHLKETIDVLKQMYDQKRAELERSHLRFENSTEEYRKMGHALETQLSDSESTFETQRLNFLRDLEFQQSQIEDLERNQTELKSIVVKSNGEMTRLRKRMTEDKAQFDDDLSKHVSRTKLEIDGLKRRLAVEKTRREEAEKERVDLESEVTSLKGKLAEMADDQLVDSMRKQMRQLSVDKQSLAELLKEKNMEISLIKREYKSDLENHKKGFQSVVGENSQLIDELIKLQAQCVERDESIYTEKKLASNLRSQLTLYEKSLEMKKAELASMRVNVAERDQLLSTRDETLDGLQKEIAKILVENKLELELRKCEWYAEKRLLEMELRETKIQSSERADAIQALSSQLSKTQLLLEGLQGKILQTKNEYLEESRRVSVREVELMRQIGSLEESNELLTRGIQSDRIQIGSTVELVERAEQRATEQSGRLREVESVCEMLRKELAESGMAFKLQLDELMNSHASELTSVQIALLREREAVTNQYEKELGRVRLELGNSKSLVQRLEKFNQDLITDLDAVKASRDILLMQLDSLKEDLKFSHF